MIAGLLFFAVSRLKTSGALWLCLPALFLAFAQGVFWIYCSILSGYFTNSPVLRNVPLAIAVALLGFIGACVWTGILIYRTAKSRKLPQAGSPPGAS